jgi:hypothetical protein
MQEAMHCAAIKAAEQSIIEQLLAQGVHGQLHVSWDVPCPPMTVNWPSKVWRGACGGKDIYLVN